MKTKLYKIAFSVIFSCSLFTLQIQAQQVRVFNTENSGLPYNNVTSIAIDAQGNKWFGTSIGAVAKFDDTKWAVYDYSNSSLPFNCDINSIEIDNEGNKWFGTYDRSVWGGDGGLVKFDNSNWTIYNKSNSGLPNNTVTGIAIDKLGNKWIATHKGVAKFDETNWTVYNSVNSELLDDYVSEIEIDALGNKWLLTGYAVVKFDDNNWTIYNYSKSIIPYYNGNGGVISIAIDDEENKWFGISEDWDSGDKGGVTKFDDVNWTIFSSNNSGLPYSVHCIAIDKKGNKWFGTSYWNVGALVKFDGINWTVYDSANAGFPNDWIVSLAIDEQGNKWFSTGNSGVVVFNENGLTTGLSDNISVHPDDFAVYPNPAKDFISIDGLQSGALKIYNSAGAVLKNAEVQGTLIKVDISDLTGGIYTIRVTTKDHVITKKFIKE